MALSFVAQAVRTAVLQQLRVPVVAQQCPTLPLLNQVITRGMAGFLDRSEVSERVMFVAKHFEKVDPAKVTPVAHFEKDLGLDSLDTVELVMALEDEFDVDIPDKEADKITSVEDAVNYICSNPLAK